MTSIFSNNSFFNREISANQSAQYQFGKKASNPECCTIDKCFSGKTQIQRQCDKTSSEQQQLSLFVDNLIFDESEQPNNEEHYDTKTHEQIENNILDVIDEDPVSIFNPFKQPDANSDHSDLKIHSQTPQQLKRYSSQELSPASPSTQASEDVQSNSIFSASSSNSIFQSPTFCQNTFQQVQVQDFAQILAEGTTEVEQKVNKRDQFEFPDGGWECSQCSNYNFKGRKCCFRCKKERDNTDTRGKPSHMKMSEQERVAQKDAKAYKNSNKKQWQKKKATKQNDKNEPTHTRPGDWTCVRCQNFNYSFRDSCNKCGLLIQEHNYYSANFAPNTIDWNQVQLQAQNMFNQPQGQLYYFDQNNMAGQQSNTQIFALVVPPTHQQQQQQWFPSC